MGLGNIGDEYRDTRHNIGFTVLDAFAGEASIRPSTERLRRRGAYACKNQQLVLLKPSTYMNLSGNAVRILEEGEKRVDLDHITCGGRRHKSSTFRRHTHPKDAAATPSHNGLKNIAAMLGGDAYRGSASGLATTFRGGCQVDYSAGTLSGRGAQAAPRACGCGLRGPSHLRLRELGWPCASSATSDMAEVRIDKWLWAVRVFKTRTIAHRRLQEGPRDDGRRERQALARHEAGRYGAGA